MMLDDLRMISMLDWLENDLLLTIDSCESASSDASFRRYFRIKASEGQFIVMDAPPEKENIEPFIRVAGLFSRSQVNVPGIFQKNLIDGFLLLEDFGSECFLDRLKAHNVSTSYQSAIDTLFNLQANTAIENCGLPSYNETLLQRELAIFEDWFLNQWLDIQIHPSIWEAVRTLLVDSALEQPVVCVHRDYHSRNLMVLKDGSTGVIDFQDAVVGPITYDLVSLLRDCYISWPDQQVDQWMIQYYQRLLKAGFITCNAIQFKRWFDLMGLQRHLKAVGIFSRLHIRDNKSNYLNDIPRTMAYITAICKTYPELVGFNDFLQKKVLPAYDKFSSFLSNQGVVEEFVTT
jgi:aminoglycoside/choline kinase family phosphotransferase